jgi:hypothetical protein
MLHVEIQGLRLTHRSRDRNGAYAHGPRSQDIVVGITHMDDLSWLKTRAAQGALEYLGRRLLHPYLPGNQDDLETVHEPRCREHLIDMGRMVKVRNESQGVPLPERLKHRTTVRIKHNMALPGPHKGVGDVENGLRGYVQAKRHPEGVNTVFERGKAIRTGWRFRFAKEAVTLGGKRYWGDGQAMTTETVVEVGQSVPPRGLHVAVLQESAI